MPPSHTVSDWLTSISLEQFSGSLSMGSLQDVERIDACALQMAGLDQAQIKMFFRGRRTLRTRVSAASPVKVGPGGLGHYRASPVKRNPLSDFGNLNLNPGGRPNGQDGGRPDGEEAFVNACIAGNVRAPGPCPPPVDAACAWDYCAATTSSPTLSLLALPTFLPTLFVRRLPSDSLPPLRRAGAGHVPDAQGRQPAGALLRNRRPHHPADVRREERQTDPRSAIGLHASSQFCPDGLMSHDRSRVFPREPGLRGGPARGLPGRDRQARR